MDGKRGIKACLQQASADGGPAEEEFSDSSSDGR
jgi:hypothetical protein